MKIRNGFVSNSSSSSFVIIDYKNKPSKIDMGIDTLIVSQEMGKNQFGWEEETSFDWGSKVIFCYLQTLYARNKYSKFNLFADTWLDMLETVIKDYTGCKKIEWLLSIENYTAENNSWIDHASSAVENRNTKMFDTYEDLARFIFGNKSFIQTGNDNG